MKSYTTLRNLYGSFTSNTTTSNLTLGDQLINDGIRKIIGMPDDWYFLEATTTIPTVATQNSYLLPYNFDKLNTITITIGNYKYPVYEVPNRQYWDELQKINYSSTIPEYYYIDTGKIFIYPTPSASANTITYNYRLGVRDLANADFTTGTVSITNGATAVTGIGTTFTAAMVGRYLQVTADGYWYKIATFTSTTSIGLEKTFQGTTVVAGPYTIGEMSVLPEDFQDLPIYYAAMMYFTIRNADIRKEKEFAVLWEEGIKRLEAYSSKSSVVSIKKPRQLINPNLFITA